MRQEMDEPSTGDYLAFRAMIAVPMISTLFYCSLLLVACGCFALWKWRSGIDGPGQSLFEALLAFFVMGICARIFCESLIVVFKIHEALQKLLRQGHVPIPRAAPIVNETMERQEPLVPTSGLKVYT